MSGCRKIECLSLCCSEIRNSLGDLSLRINSIQSSLREFEKQKFDPLNERLSIMEKWNANHCQRGLDQADKLNCLDTRLTELEQWTRADEDRIYAKLKSMQDQISAIMLQIPEEIEERIEHQKKPHKCPVCEGMKTHKRMFTHGDQLVCVEDNCICCKGEGIVWG